MWELYDADETEFFREKNDGIVTDPKERRQILQTGIDIDDINIP